MRGLWVNPKPRKSAKRSAADSPEMVQRLWVRPTFGEDNERSDVGSPEIGSRRNEVKSTIQEHQKGLTRYF